MRQWKRSEGAERGEREKRKKEGNSRRQKKCQRMNVRNIKMKDWIQTHTCKWEITK